MDGLFGGEADHYLSGLAEYLAGKWELNYSNIIGWVRAWLSFAILWATNLCSRGSKSRWRSLGIEDGVPIEMIMK